MSLKDQIKIINENYSIAIQEYSNKYKSAIEDTLKHLGVWETDVYNKRTGKKGILKIVKNTFGDISWEVKFVPYKKDGNLSSSYENIYVYCGFGDFEKELMQKITRGIENDR